MVESRVILLGVCVGRWRPAWLGWARAPTRLPVTAAGFPRSENRPPAARAAILDPKPRQPAANPRPARQPLGNILMSIAIL